MAFRNRPFFLSGVDPLFLVAARLRAVKGVLPFHIIGIYGLFLTELTTEVLETMSCSPFEINRYENTSKGVSLVSVLIKILIKK